MTEENQDRFGAENSTPPPPSRPVPDLGFFAGQAAPGSSQFGGSPSTFGGPGPSPFGSTPAVNQFGSPPAVNQLGSPGGFGAAPVMAPAGSLPGSGTNGASSTVGRWVGRAAVGLAIAAVLGFFGIGRLSELAIFGGDGVTVPETLGGLQRSSDEATRQLLNDAIDRVETEFGEDLAVEVYGEGLASVILFAGENGEVVSEEQVTALMNANAPGANARVVGPNVCAEMSMGGMTASVCAHAEDGKVVAVSATRGAEETSALTSEAWAAQ